MPAPGSRCRKVESGREPSVYFGSAAGQSGQSLSEALEQMSISQLLRPEANRHKSPIGGITFQTAGSAFRRHEMHRAPNAPTFENAPTRSH